MQTRRDFLRSAGRLAATVALSCGATVSGCTGQQGKRRRPSFILVLTDDQGFNDLGCFDSRLIRTPCIDRMAQEGLTLTSFYASAPLCSPSRVSLLTGCYSQRVAERGGKKHYHTILHRSEILLPEVLKEAGYATCAVGKWHLAGCGGQAIATDKRREGLDRYSMVDPSVMPRQKGFDSYFGIPYSNDMKPVVLMRDNDFIEELGQTDKQTGISTRYTDEVLRFIDHHQQEPFFVYLAHNMPHTPLYPSKQFEGKSAYGLYGDCIEEIDWNMGRLFARLKELDLDRDTFVVFASDNGPWIEPKVKGRTSDARTSRLQAGCAKPLRGAKMTTWEGGPRVPCVMRYPSLIPAGKTTDELVTTMDIFATFAGLADARVPTDRTLDSIDMTPLLTGRVSQSPRDSYFFYKYTHLHGVRSGRWKLLLPREGYPKSLGWYGRLQEEIKDVTLYDLRNDIAETRNVAAAHPQVVKRLMRLIEHARQDLGDRDRKGAGVRTDLPSGATGTSSR